MSWADLTAALPGLRGQRVHVVRTEREAEVRGVLESHGFHVYTLMGSAISNESTFFSEAARGLALPGWFGANWDALYDTLGDVAEALPARKAILWTDADQSIAADAQTVLSAVLAFESAAVDAAGAEEGPRQLEVFLLGSGAGFGAA